MARQPSVRGRNCKSAAGPETTFLYVGARADVISLHYLRCSETRILYIDPLLPLEAWERGEGEMVEQRDPGPLTQPLVDEHVRQLLHDLSRATLHACTLSSGASGLSDFQLLGHSMGRHGDFSSVEVSFMGGGVQRTLQYVFGQVQQVNISALTSVDGIYRPISTLEYIGVSSTNAVAALKATCPNYTATKLRLIGNHEGAHAPLILEAASRTAEDMLSWGHKCFQSSLSRARSERRANNTNSPCTLVHAGRVALGLHTRPSRLTSGISVRRADNESGRVSQLPRRPRHPYASLTYPQRLDLFCPHAHLPAEDSSRKSWIRAYTVS